MNQRDFEESLSHSNLKEARTMLSDARLLIELREDVPVNIFFTHCHLLAYIKRNEKFSDIHSRLFLLLGTMMCEQGSKIKISPQ